MLRDAAKRLFRVVVKKQPKPEKKLPQLPELKRDQEELEKVWIAKEIVEDERLPANKGIMSAIDPDARFGWKSNTKSFFGYKEQIAMTEEEIITAVEVTGGSSDDGKQFKELLYQSLAVGIEDSTCCPAKSSRT